MDDKKKEFVYTLQNGKKLTKLEFIKYFENKVFKTIRRFNLFNLNDKLIVAVSGEKDSIVTLYLTYKYLKKKNLQKNIIALSINEGVKDYREKTINYLREFCKKYDIKLVVANYKEEFNLTTDKIYKKIVEEGLNLSPCQVCGTLRRYILNKKARELKGTKLVLGHNLDDEAKSIMLNILKNNFNVFLRLGPYNGLVRDEKFIPRVKPLYLMSEEEIILYVKLKNFNIVKRKCPYSKLSIRYDIDKILNKLENKLPGTKNSVINFYLDLKEYINENTIKKTENKKEKLNYCKICGEPSENDICNTCKFLQKFTD